MQYFADEPDDTRPSNPWPRLLALGAVLLFIFVSVGACLVNFASTGAAAELRVPLDQLQVGVPRFEPVTRWGADPQGFTYGAWIVQTPEAGTRAFFSRNVGSTCNVQWQPTAQLGGTTGLFRDPCDDATFAIDGEGRGPRAPRGLDQFELRVEAGEVIVNVGSISIGQCLAYAETGVIGVIGVICVSGSSAPPITRTVPLTGSIPAEFGRR